MLQYVTLPLARTALIAGFVFAFILSFVNLPLSLFLTNPGTATLPIVMFAYMESRIDPLVAAVASMVVLAAVLITFTVERVFRRRRVHAALIVRSCAFALLRIGDRRSAPAP